MTDSEIFLTLLPSQESQGYDTSNKPSNSCSHRYRLKYGLNTVGTGSDNSIHLSGVSQFPASNVKDNSVRSGKVSKRHCCIYVFNKRETIGDCNENEQEISGNGEIDVCLLIDRGSEHGTFYGSKRDKKNKNKANELKRLEVGIPVEVEFNKATEKQIKLLLGNVEFKLSKEPTEAKSELFLKQTKNDENVNHSVIELSSEDNSGFSSDIGVPHRPTNNIEISATKSTSHPVSVLNLSPSVESLDRTEVESRETLLALTQKDEAHDPNSRLYRASIATLKDSSVKSQQTSTTPRKSTIRGSTEKIRISSQASQNLITPKLPKQSHSKTTKKSNTLWEISQQETGIKSGIILKPGSSGTPKHSSLRKQPPKQSKFPSSISKEKSTTKALKNLKVMIEPNNVFSPSQHIDGNGIQPGQPQTEEIMLTPEIRNLTQSSSDMNQPVDPPNRANKDPRTSSRRISRIKLLDEENNDTKNKEAAGFDLDQNVLQSARKKRKKRSRNDLESKPKEKIKRLKSKRVTQERVIVKQWPKQFQAIFTVLSKQDLRITATLKRKLSRKDPRIIYTDSTLKDLKCFSNVLLILSTNRITRTLKVLTAMSLANGPKLVNLQFLQDYAASDSENIQDVLMQLQAEKYAPIDKNYSKTYPKYCKDYRKFPKGQQTLCLDLNQVNRKREQKTWDGFFKKTVFLLTKNIQPCVDDLRVFLRNLGTPAENVHLIAVARDVDEVLKAANNLNNFVCLTSEKDYRSQKGKAILDCLSKPKNKSLKIRLLDVSWLTHGLLEYEFDLENENYHIDS